VIGNLHEVDATNAFYENGRGKPQVNLMSFGELNLRRFKLTPDGPVSPLSIRDCNRSFDVLRNSAFMKSLDSQVHRSVFIESLWFALVIFMVYLLECCTEAIFRRVTNLQVIKSGRGGIVKIGLLGIFCASFAIGFSSPQPVNAGSFSISFYEETTQPGSNFFTDYTLVGVGLFEIASSAVTPDNLVMFSAPEFLSFEVSLSLSTGDSSTFTLGIDDFEEGDTRERGLLFDGSGAPLRFDRPNTVASNARSMCEPVCEIALGARATLSLLDADTYEGVYLEDGSITTRSNVLGGLPPGTPFTPFAGAWTYAKGTSYDGGSGSGTGGLYKLGEVPIPAAFWLFGTGLLGLAGVAKRKKVA
ncbi:MAG: VPLPA-CTERM sorting domain-containing protein, partial [bacterium]